MGQPFTELGSLSPKRIFMGEIELTAPSDDGTFHALGMSKTSKESDGMQGENW